MVLIVVVVGVVVVVVEAVLGVGSVSLLVLTAATNAVFRIMRKTEVHFLIELKPFQF